jgi:hypothetical protein
MGLQAVGVMQHMALSAVIIIITITITIIITIVITL